MHTETDNMVNTISAQTASYIQLQPQHKPYVEDS